MLIASFSGINLKIEIISDTYVKLHYGQNCGIMLVITVYIPGSKFIRAVVKLLTHPLPENTYPHFKEKISADVTYAQHTVVHHLGLDISLLDAATNFNLMIDDLSNFSKLIELVIYYKQLLFTADTGT